MDAITKLTPLSTVQVIKGAGLTPAYTDCLTFSNSTGRYNWFNSRKKYTFTNAIPVRNNVIRVPQSADNLMDCDYVMWQNQNFGTRWFYGFITNMTWINLNVTEITVEIDVITTWQFDVFYQPSYVVRQHVSDPGNSAYTQPEPLDVGQRIYIEKSRTQFEGEIQGAEFEIALFFVPQNPTFPIYRYGMITSMCQVEFTPLGNMSGMYNQYVKPLVDVGLQDNVIGAVVIPSFVKTPDTQNNSAGKYIKQVNISAFQQNLDGYVPINKKLLQYPFNSLVVASGNGVQQEYRLEMFTKANPKFCCWGTVCLDPIIYGDFVEYGNGETTPEGTMSPATVNISSGWPQVMFSGIQSLAYAQNVASAALNATSGIFGMAGAIATANPMGVIGAAATTAAGAFQAAQAINVPPIAQVGQIPTSTTSFALFRGNFVFLQHTIDRGRAEAYDRFLTRWGYALNTTRPINFNTRQNFDYIETKDIAITGPLPVDQLQKYRDVFNNGVTFWHTERGSFVGNWNGGAGGNDPV